MTAHIDTHGASGRHGTRGTNGRDGRAGIHALAIDGEDGHPGGDGGPGGDARPAEVALDFDGERVVARGPTGAVDASRGLSVSAVGGRGGDGGAGGDGGDGAREHLSTPQAPGTPPGRGGRGGNGGHGGDGGDGAPIVVRAADPHLLALVRTLDARGGEGGDAGPGGRSGALGALHPTGTAGRPVGHGALGTYHHPGAAGRPGRPGRSAHTCLRVVVDGATVEEGATIGARVTGLAGRFEPPCIDAHLARGARVVLTRATVHNVGALTLPPPFIVPIHGSGPLAVDPGAHLVVDVPIAPGATAEATGEVEVRVAEHAELGPVALTARVQSRRGPLTIDLEPADGRGAFGYTITHRLDRARLAGGPPDKRDRWQALIDRFDPLPADEQVATAAAWLLAPLLRAAALTPEDPRAEELAAMVEGNLLDRGRFVAAWRALDAADPADRPLCVEAGAEVFAALAIEARAKIMDAALFIATTDRTITVEEKAHIQRIAALMALPADWLATHMPQLIGAGAVTVRARHTNRPAALAVPVMTWAFYATAAVIIADRAGADAPWLTRVDDFAHVFVQLALAAGAHLLALLVLVPLAFHKACRECQSLAVEPIDATGSAITGAAEGWRCTDCGARLSDVPQSPRALYHLHRPAAPGGSRIGPVLAGITAAIAGAFVYTHPAPPWPVLAVGAGAALLSSLVFRVHRRHTTFTSLAGPLAVASILGALAPALAPTRPPSPPDVRWLPPDQRPGATPKPAPPRPQIITVNLGDGCRLRRAPSFEAATVRNIARDRSCHLDPAAPPVPDWHAVRCDDDRGFMHVACGPITAAPP